MNRFLAALFAGCLIAAGCSSTTEPAPPPDTLFPPTTTQVVEPVEPTVPVVTTTTAGSATTTVAPTTTVPTATEVALADHSLTFRPVSDSFAFENFGGGTAPADLTVNMARRLYGDEQVCSAVADNQCTPYPVILQLIQQANRSMQGGLCEGLAVLSLRLANDPITLASFQNVDEVSALVKEDPALLSELAYWYVTQFAVEVQQEASAYLEMHPTQLAEILLRDFAAAEAGEPSTGYTIGIYSDMGGHAVTPYRTEETANGYRIYIYDSNWPTSERWIDVDKDGWVYALAATNPTEEASAWGGATGTMELTPMRSRSGPFSCGFCPSDTEAKSGTLLTVASTGDKQMALKIETESGDRLGYYDGTFVNEIEGATYRYLISGPTTADPVLVFLPPDVETFSADVEEIDVPTPVDDEPISSPTDNSAAAEPEEAPPLSEDEPTQKFSLLLLDDEKSVQIEATIVEEVEPDPDEPEVEEEVSLIDFSDGGVSIAEVQDATVAIAIDALAVEVELDEGQTIEVVIAPDPPPPPDTPDSPDVPVVEEAPQMLDLSIQNDEGEVLAEVEVDLTLYLIPEAPEPEPEPTPGAPADTTPPPPPTPAPVSVVIEITFDEDTGVVQQEEEAVEAWVASDAEYYQAIVEDNLEEVLGESYVEELEEREEWVDEDEAEARAFLSTVLEEVSDDYWEDEHWEEISYDEEWFEEEYEEEVWEEVLDAEDWFEEGADEWMDEWAEEEELHILEEFGLEEWNDELMGPSPTETMEWEEEDWETYDAEMEAMWEEEWEEDPEEWEDEWEEVWEEEEWEDEWEEVLEEEESWELDTEEEWDDWQEEFWPEDGEWCDECESGPWDEEDWDEPWEQEDWTAEDEESLILEEFGLEEWPEDWGPPPSETWEWTEEDWEAYDEEMETLWEDEEPAEQEFDDDVQEEEDPPPPEEEEWEDDPVEEWEEDQHDGEEATDETLDEDDLDPLDDPEWEDEDDPFTDDPEDDTTLDEEPLSDPDLPPETEVDEEQVDEEEVPTTTTVEPPPTTTEPPPPTTTEPPPTTTIPPPTTTVPPPPPTTVPSWDPYAACRGTDACSMAPGGFTTWEAYDAANDPTYYDDLGTPPGGYETWQVFIVEVEAGIVDADVAAEVLPEEMAEEFIPPPPPVYVPTVTMTNIAVALQETISTSTATAQTGTATSTNVSATESGILTQNINDGHWHLDTTTVTTTATTVTNTLVDTTTVVARTGVDYVSCTYVDNVQSGCSTQRSWNDPTTTATAGDAYTEASTTTAVVSATVGTEEGCAEGGFRGMGDWCMVTSGGRNDRDLIQFTLDETTNVRIDAETNLTYAQFVAGNHEYGDPYIYLNNDNDPDEGEHSADESQITVGSLIEQDDDGGRDCNPTSVCINPPSTATDPDETPTITYCSSGGACSNGVPVIDNVSDVWDSEIVRINLPAGDYVVQAATYSNGHDGWYRLTIEEDE